MATGRATILSEGIGASEELAMAVLSSRLDVRTQPSVTAVVGRAGGPRCSTRDEDKVRGRQGQRLEGRRPLRDRGFRDNYCKIYKRLREVGTSEGSIPLP